MQLRELFEAEKKVAVAAFGRLNPPTIGHNVLIKRIKSFPGDHFLFLSHSQGAKKPDAKPGTKAGENADPLSFEEKLPIIQQAYPDIKVGFAGIKTPIQMMEKLYELGYTDVIVLGGPERINAYKQQIPKYNGEGNLYNFNSIEFELSGDRDADADDASGMSASKLRKAVRDGDMDAFKQGLMGGDPNKLFAVIKDRLAKDSIGLTQKEPEMAEDVSPEDEDKFHNELDDLVHKYFGDSPDEEKMKKKMKKVKEVYPNQQFSIYNPDGDTYKGKKIYNKSKHDALDLPTTDEVPDDEYTPDLDKDELKKVMAKSVSSLTSREKQVLHMRFTKEMTLDQIGKVLGVGRDRARQIEQRALRKLRHPKRSDNLAPFLEGSVTVPARQLHDMVLELVNDVDYNDTKTLAKIARTLGKEVFYKNDRVVIQDPDFDFYKDK